MTATPTATTPVERPKIALDPTQQAALDLMQSGKNVFLTGNAGTGKSTVVTTFLSQAFRRVDVTATTGVAALNLRDQFYSRSGLTISVSTLFRWSGIALGPSDGECNEACYARLRQKCPPSRMGAWARVRRAECLIVDEISMLTGRVFDFAEWLCRELRDDKRPWGGMQIIAVGDFLQLPPVSHSGVYDWCFLSPAWERTGFKPALLTKIHRQADPLFMDLLNAVRVGRIGAAHMALLKTRVARFPASTLLRLFTHNVQVDKWNDARLDALDGDPTTYVMTDDGGPEVDFLKKNLLTPERLRLKVGARVMITVNLPGEFPGTLLAVNGSLGSVIDHNPDFVTILLDDGRTLSLGQYVWNANPLDESAGQVTQFPLRLAWAATIHKIQGLSLDAALIDARATRDPGQCYVGLSRVRSLSGLWLRDMFTGVWVSQQAISFMQKLQ